MLQGGRKRQSRCRNVDNYKRSPRRKTSVRQRWLPIEAAPQKVRDHGLGDAHSRPLVSPGKIAGSFAVSFRVAPWAAWLFPSLELRAANSYTCLILDLDGWGSYERAERAVRRTKVGALNWAVENKRTGGVHGVWTLAKPVHRADMALAAPLKRYGRISEYYAAVVGADAGYTGVLTHNPMEDAQLPGFETHWLRREPYTLDELAAFIPFGWRRPKVSRTAVGRNCDVFAHCMRWAGSPANLGARSWVRLIGSMTASSTLWTRRKSPGSRDRQSATAGSGSSGASSGPWGMRSGRPGAGSGGSEADWPAVSDAGPRPSHRPGLAMRNLHTLALAAPRAHQTRDKEDSPAGCPLWQRGGNRTKQVSQD